MRETDIETEQKEALGSTVVTNRSWLELKLDIVECLLYINSEKELMRWNNQLLKNIRLQDKGKLREIAALIDTRRQQITKRLK